jgi:hypothetical protein
MTFPPGRYGRRRQARRTPRWLPAAAVVIVVLVGLLLAGRLYRQYGDPYQPSAPTLEQVGDSSVTVSFTVRKGSAMCRIQANDSSGHEVGYVEVRVPVAGPVRATVSTAGRAGRVEVLGCRPA